MIDPVQRALDSLSDESSVDWDALEAESPDANTRVTLQALRDISAIARAQRVPTPFLPHALPFKWGPLEVREYLARGAHGDVYRAWDPRLEREVALKLLRPHLSSSDDTTFAIAEGRLLARVRHPNIVAVYGADRIDSQDGIWMELVDGRTLREVVTSDGPLPADDVMRIGLQICSGLAAIHAAGLVHRDVKAQNVVRDRSGRTILMDLGAGQDGCEIDDRLQGTPLYLAPELLDGGPATVASDMYALGVLLFFLASGRYPVAAGSIEALREQHRAERLTRLPDDIPAPLADVIRRALHADKARRFRSADELAGALRATQIAARSRVSRPLVVALGAVVVLALTALASWRAPAATTAGVPFNARDWVLIASVDNTTDNRRLDDALQFALAHAIGASSHVNVVPAERIDDALRLMRLPSWSRVDERLAKEIALRDGNIKLVVAGRLEGRHPHYSLALRLVDPATGNTLAVSTHQAAGENEVLPATHEAARWLRRALGETAIAAGEAPTLQKATTGSLNALRLYSQAQIAARGARWPEVEATLTDALLHDPEFASAHIWMAWALANQGRGAESRAAAERALLLADAASPRERYFIRASYSILTANRPKAIGELQALLRQYPDDYWGAFKLSELYTSAGRIADARDVAVRVAAIRPQDLVTQAELLRMVTLTDGAAAARAQAAVARRLLEQLPEDATATLEASYVSLFPVHDAWAHRRPREAVRLLDGADARWDGVALDWERLRRATMRLSLGQLQEAKEVVIAVGDANLRTLGLANLYLASGHRDRIPALMKQYAGGDLSSVSLLIRAGHPADAQRMLHRLPVVDREHTQWSAAELEVARSKAQRALKTLEEGASVLRRITGVRAFFYSETLAEALVHAGQIDEAIRVLERVGDIDDNLFNRGGHTGYLWLRTQRLRADLLHRTGRTAEAHAIETDLLTILAAADDDHPIVVQLRRRRR